MAIFILPLLALLASDVTATVEPNEPLLYDRDSTGNSAICPVWETFDASRNACQCANISGDPLICHNHVYLLLVCYCATVVGNKTEVGHCAIRCAHRKDETMNVNQRLPSSRSTWNDFMCKEFGRSGTLCGQCDKERNYYPRAYSFDMSCTQCDGSMSSNLWKYIALAYLPLTVFYLLVFFLKLDIHSSRLCGFIIFSQFMSMPAIVRNFLQSTKNTLSTVGYFARILFTFYGFWNLDFFRTYDNGICFQISSLANLSLDFGVALYPLLLMLITYFLVHLYWLNYKPLIVLWKPAQSIINRWHWHFHAKTSLVNSFAAFLLLSNFKLFSVCLDILTPVKVHYFDTPDKVNVTWRLYYDPTVEYFGIQHRGYGIAAVSMVLFCIMPAIFFLLYSVSFFQKIISLLPLRWQLSLHTLVDSVQGCYKDGTEHGMMDCRWYNPMFIYVIRFLLVVVYGCTLSSLALIFGSMIITMFVILTINLDPFKSHLTYLGTSVVIFTLFIDALYMCVISASMAEWMGNPKLLLFIYTLSSVIGTLPIFYVTYLVLCWLCSLKKQ